MNRISTVGQPTLKKRGMKEMHPYMYNNFEGTPEIQEIRRKMYDTSEEKLCTIDFTK